MSADLSRRRGKIKNAIGAVAPQLAHALGGPLAGAAAEALSRALFGTGADDPPDEAAIEAAVVAPDPATLARIKEAEQAFLVALIDADVEASRIAAKDRADARARQASLKDWTPSVIGMAVIAGFFAVLAAMVWRRLPPGAETEFSIMLGALATMTAAVVNYFFGSSAGSREKTWMMIGGKGPHKD